MDHLTYIYPAPFKYHLALVLITGFGDYIGYGTINMLYYSIVHLKLV